MSSEGARAAFIEAFYEVIAPKVKQISVAIEVRLLLLFSFFEYAPPEDGTRRHGNG